MQRCCDRSLMLALSLGIVGAARRANRAADRRSAPAVCLRADGPADAVPLYVPKTWDGKASLPIILMLARRRREREHAISIMADGLLDASSPSSTATSSSRRSASRRSAPTAIRCGCRPCSANREAAAAQRAAVTPERQRELNLSELEVMTALEIVTEEYGADRSRTFLAGHSMGSGGAWHLAARYPERWRAVAPMSGPFVDKATYPFDRIKRSADLHDRRHRRDAVARRQPRAGASSCARVASTFEYLEVDGNHGSMVPMVWPRSSSSSIASRRGRE